MTHHDERTTDRLAELLQHSGPRPAPSAKGIESARAAAYEAWQSDVHLVKRRAIVRNAVFALATAAVLAIAVARYPSSEVAQDAPPLRVATIEGSNRTVQINEVVRTGSDLSRLRLSNGVELRLDTDTEIRFSAPAAVTLDRGALYVDTGSSGAGSRAGRSVEIRTAAGIARDIGTRFEVRLIADAMRVRVRDGLVQLERNGEAHTAQRGIEVLAGPTGVTQRTVPIAGTDWNWIALAAAPFNVEGKTLSAFLEWASREGGWEIRFSDQAVRTSTAAIVLHGSIAGLTPDQAMETILPTCGLAHRIDGSVVTITRAARSGDKQ